MEILDWAELVGIVLSLLLSVGGLLKITATFKSENKIANLNVGGTVIDDNKTALEVSQLAMAQVKELKTEVVNLEAEVQALRHWAEQLSAQVKEHGGIPVKYKPPIKLLDTAE